VGTGATGPTGDQGGTGPDGPTGDTGPQANNYFLTFTISNGVPTSGTRYANVGQNVLSSEVGIRLPAASTLVGITYSADATPGASRTYDVEVISDPAGTPSIEATLAIGNAESADSRRDLSVAIGATTLLGVRMTRQADAGSSSFTDVVIIVELSIP
jgi:hypothetical protein